MNIAQMGYITTYNMNMPETWGDFFLGVGIGLLIIALSFLFCKTFLE